MFSKQKRHRNLFEPLYFQMWLSERVYRENRSVEIVIQHLIKSCYIPPSHNAISLQYTTLGNSITTSCFHSLPKIFCQESAHPGFSYSAVFFPVSTRCLMPGQKSDTLFLLWSCSFSQLPEVKENSLLHSCTANKASGTVSGFSACRTSSGTPYHPSLHVRQT